MKYNLGSVVTLQRDRRRMLDNIFDAEAHQRDVVYAKQELGRLAAQQVCPCCGLSKQSVKDRMLTRGYIPGQSADSHLLSCKECYDQVEQEGIQ